ncbi:hypothetical protein LWC33_32630 [Pseudonocardia sp. RS11V-5]|uniref:hypothetical protein n=1 Tax=Pseudonocardia terrae TaxID=2905831 RepID=UPI001E364AB1|nr:hypothetical protein [Pseudonocardia terrae]MCE3556175.1 hypothetical protein [Pseudonocardia terrae]
MRWEASSAGRVERAPHGLPLLTRGSHQGPANGSCLMEYVSVLAGTSFSDHPRCTHPALATVARMVNDQIGDDELRSRLALLAPDLIEIGPGELRTTDAVVACCLSAATATGPLGRGPARRLNRSWRRLRLLSGDDPWTRIWTKVRQFLHPPGASAISAMRFAIAGLGALPQQEREARLYELLSDAITASRSPSRHRPTRCAPMAPGSC